MGNGRQLSLYSTAVSCRMLLVQSCNSVEVVLKALVMNLGARFSMRLVEASHSLTESATKRQSFNAPATPSLPSRAPFDHTHI
jgi:hypothetical protein